MITMLHCGGQKELGWAWRAALLRIFVRGTASRFASTPLRSVRGVTVELANDGADLYVL